MEFGNDTTVDVIMLTNTANDDILKMTYDCIKSLNESESFVKFNIFLIESNKDFDICRFHEFAFRNVFVIRPLEEFNYNKFINIGLFNCKSEYIVVANNDLIFQKGWALNIINEFRKDKDLMSACPKEPNHHNWAKENKLYYGYTVRSELVGWCIFMRRTILDIIGKFDEQFEFFYQDDDYSQTLQKYNLKHALISNSLVNHLFNKSHSLLSEEQHNYYSRELKIKFENKWKIKWNPN